MRNLHTYANTLVQDLRRRRLLPVAALLIAALVAIPIVLSTSTGSTPVASASPPAGGPAGGAAVGARPAGPRARLSAHARDPFVQPAALAAERSTASVNSTHTSPATTTAAATVPGVATPIPPATSTPAPTKTVTVTTTVTTPAGSTKAVKAPTEYRVYGAEISFGRAAASARDYAAASRYTVLPSATHVAAIFLGVRSDARTAEFLVSNRAAVTGQGACLPSPARCTYMTLKPGQHELISLTNPSGTVSHYVLRYTALHESETTSATSIASVSKPGSTLVNKVARLLPSLRTRRYSARNGLLRIRTGTVAVQADAGGGVG